MDKIKNDFHKFTKETLSLLNKFNPVLATDLGIHDYDEELGDFSSDSTSRFSREIEQRLSQLERIDGLLDGLEKDECLLLKQILKVNLFNLNKACFFEKNPHFYVDQVLHSVFLLMLREFAPIEERVKLTEKRLTKIPEFLNESKKNLTSPMKISTEVAIETAELSEIFLDEISQKFPYLGKSVSEAKKALDSYIVWLKSILPETEKNFALGKKLYEEKLKTHHFLDLSTDEMLKIAEEEFEKTEEELKKVAREIDFSRDWFEIFQEMQNNHPSEGELLDVYVKEMEKVKEFIRENDLADLPEKETLKIEETPIFLRTLAPFAVYFTPAPFEEDQTAYFYVTPVDKNASDEEQKEILKGHNVYEIPLICLHESYPGHHLQSVKALENQSPVLRTWGSFYNTFLSEGWAVYCEELLREFGCSGNPYLHLSQLRYQIWYIIRTLLDVKLHLNQLTFEEAVKFLAGKLGVDELSATAEMQRGALDPTQLACYFNGAHKVNSLRNSYLNSKKGDSNLKRFHDEVLKNSNLPFPLLEKHFT